MPQLTITLDDNVWQAVQEYAHQHGQELAKSAADLLQAAVRPALPFETAPPSAHQLTTEQRLAMVRNLAGSLKASADFDYKQELEEGLREKYGL